MSEEIEKLYECARRVLKDLRNYYEIGDYPTFTIETKPSENVHFRALLNPTFRKFELQNPEQIKDPEIKIRLDTLNRRLKVCLEKK